MIIQIIAFLLLFTKKYLILIQSLTNISKFIKCSCFKRSLNFKVNFFAKILKFLYGRKRIRFFFSLKEQKLVRVLSVLRLSSTMRNVIKCRARFRIKHRRCISASGAECILRRIKRGTQDITTIRVLRFREPAPPPEFDDSAHPLASTRSPPPPPPPKWG